MSPDIIKQSSIIEDPNISFNLPKIEQKRDPNTVKNTSSKFSAHVAHTAINVTPNDQSDKNFTDSEKPINKTTLKNASIPQKIPPTVLDSSSAVPSVISSGSGKKTRPTPHKAPVLDFNSLRVPPGESELSSPANLLAPFKKDPASENQIGDNIKNVVEEWQTLYKDEGKARQILEEIESKARQLKKSNEKAIPRKAGRRKKRLIRNQQKIKENEYATKIQSQQQKIKDISIQIHNLKNKHDELSKKQVTADQASISLQRQSKMEYRIAVVIGYIPEATDHSLFDWNLISSVSDVEFTEIADSLRKFSKGRNPYDKFAIVEHQINPLIKRYENFKDPSIKADIDWRYEQLERKKQLKNEIDSKSNLLRTAWNKIT